MKLIIGGKAQSKTGYAQKKYNIKSEEICNGAVCSKDDIYDAYCISNFHEYIRRFGDCVDVCSLKEDVIVICDEVGLGIVPVSEKEREFRENTGRVCCRMAELSESVERIVCGIPTVIK